MSSVVEALRKKSEQRKQEIIASFITRSVNNLLTEAQREAHHGRSAAKIVTSEVPDLVHRFDKDSEKYKANPELSEDAICRRIKEELISQGFNQFEAKIVWANIPLPQEEWSHHQQFKKLRVVQISCSW